MKPGYLFIIIIFISAALGIGWIYDNRTTEIPTSSLQVPDNIDYYLSNINFRSMNQQGSIHYLLKSPYLEHFIRENISHIQKPSIQLNGEKSGWFMKAKTGKLQHKEEVFELQNQVKLKRNSQQDPMLLSTELMFIRPKTNLIDIPVDITATTDNLNLQATSAQLDIDKNNYKFNQVKVKYSTRQKTPENL